jgi:pimeloyl-ACP methyl ester carboxylesterase
MRLTLKSLVIFILVGVALWGISFGVERLRRTPTEPRKLAWSPELSVVRADLDGVKVRYVKAGSGPDLVLFHTLRTQLDIFHKMIPELAQHFTVYAVDYPGHGWSDIPDARYHPDDFYRWAEKFLDKVDAKDATVAGISIGGTIVLELAGRRNPRIAKVVSINPFDYDDTYSSGLKGSSLFAKMMFTATDAPFIGDTFMRLRNPVVERRIFEGGVADPGALSDEQFQEFAGVGNRPGHYQAFLKLLRERHNWKLAHENYRKITIPVLLIYASQDWASEKDRARTRDHIPGVRTETVENGGHFLSLDKPQELNQLIISFAEEN